MTKQPGQRTYEAEVYQQAHDATGLGDNFFTAPIADATAQHDAARYSVSQGQNLARGQEMRGDAPGPDAHYLGYPHQQLYDMVNVDLDADTIDQRGRIANEMGNWLSEVRTQADRATQAEGAAWQGPAAEQAHGFVKGTADWMDGTAQASWLASNRYSQQAAAASNAKNAMPDPVPFDQAAEMEAARQHFQSGNIADLTEGARMLEQMEAKQRAAQEAHEQAARVLESMDSTYYETASSQPAFTPPPTMSGDQGTSASGFSGTQNVVGGSAPLPPASAGGVPISGSGGVPTAGSPGHLSSSSPITGQGPGGGTSGGGGFSTPRPGGGGTIGGTLGPGGAGLGRVGSETTRGPRGRGGSPRANFAGGRVSGGGYSPGKGGSAGGGSAGGRLGSAAPGSKGAEPGAGKSTGTGSTGPKSESIARGGAAASGARGGATGMGPMGAGGRGKKEEDEEKKSAEYLQEADPESIFGSRPTEGPNGEKITPPVIGEKGK
jgi:hypothetical protein